MNRLLFTCLLVLIGAIAATCQDKKHYVAAGLGPSFILESHVKAPTGLNLNANAAFLVYNGLGVTATAAFGGHINETTTHDMFDPSIVVPMEVQISYRSYMLGPMYAFKLAGKTFIDVKARAGVFIHRTSYESANFSGTERTSRPTYSLGLALRQHIARRWCLLAYADYYTSEDGHGKPFRVITANGGVGFLF